MNPLPLAILAGSGGIGCQFIYLWSTLCWMNLPQSKPSHWNEVTTCDWHHRTHPRKSGHQICCRVSKHLGEMWEREPFAFPSLSTVCCFPVSNKLSLLIISGVKQLREKTTSTSHSLGGKIRLLALDAQLPSALLFGATDSKLISPGTKAVCFGEHD